MRLNILTVEASNNVEIFQNKIPFRYIAHHVKEIYLYLFPKDISINNSSKIALEFGHKVNEPIFDNILGVTNYFIEIFDFNTFYKISQNKQENVILENIKYSFIEISKIKGEDDNIINGIKATTNKVIENKFNLEINIRKLSKISLDKKYKIEIFRILNREVGEGWKYKIINRIDKEIIEENWIMQIPNYLDKTEYYKKSEIVNKEYLIYNNLGKITYRKKLE
jgi:hypothetical protein